MKTTKLLLFSLFCATTVGLKAQSQYKINNTIPELEVKYLDRVDTVTIYDYDTGEEEVMTVKNNVPYVERVDTISVLDFDTYEEKITIILDEILLRSFYHEYGDKWFDRSESHVEHVKHNMNLPKDTIIIFDADTYEERVQVLTRRHDCFLFKWGDTYFSDAHNISLTKFKELLNSEVRVIEAKSVLCEKVNEYECRVVIVSPEADPFMMRLTNAHPSPEMQKMYKSLVKSGSKVFIEDIKVNGKRVIDSIVLTVGS